MEIINALCCFLPGPGLTGNFLKWVYNSYIIWSQVGSILYQYSQENKHKGWSKTRGSSEKRLKIFLLVHSALIDS